MPRILSIGGHINPKDLKENPMKALWEGFRGLDKFIKFLIVSILLIVLATPYIAHNFLQTHQHADQGIVVRAGSDFSLNGAPYKFVGYDVYNANSRSNCWYPLGNNDNQLDSLLSQAPGTKAIRAWFFNDLAGTPSARDWSAFDHTIAVANAHNIKIIATLGNEWGDCDSPNGVRKTRTWYETGYTQPEANGESYRDWVKEVVTHYANEPAILSFDLMNEPETPEDSAGTCNESLAAPALKAWANDVSNMAKSLTPHLITLSTIGSGQCGTQGSDYQSLFSLSGLDACDYHDYDTPTAPIPGDQYNGLQVRINQCQALGKPFIISESGIKGSDVGGNLQLRATDFNAKLAAWFAAGIDGATLWNLCLTHDSAYGQCDSSSYDFTVPSDPILGVVSSFSNSSPTPIPSSSPTPTPTSSPTSGWTFCANENQYCTFTGNAQVRYGANGIYNYGTYTATVACGNSVFGDPVPNVTKHCDYSTSTSPTPTPTPTPTISPTATPVSDLIRPTISITNPANNSTLKRGTIVTFQAQASDNVGVVRVDFLVNGTKVCSDTTSPYSCAWTVPGKPNAPYTISAFAYDAAGNAGTSFINVSSGR